jgi:hypothetical protein
VPHISHNTIEQLVPGLVAIEKNVGNYKNEDRDRDVAIGATKRRAKGLGRLLLGWWQY